MVYVLDNNGTPLMPTTRHGHVRQLLREGRAVVVRKDIFTIQLTYESTKYIQEVRLGVDCGSKHIGLSATTRKKELVDAVGELRTDVSKLILSRRETRRTRRSRLWHRQPRFNNRVSSKKPGWLPPSIHNKIDFHFKLIKLIHAILPISRVILEVGNFDPQLINNPEISGIEYQEGPSKGFDNVKAAVLSRDRHTCQYCHGKSGVSMLHVHHIRFRSHGGSDSITNLITLCEKCHRDLHDGKIELKVKKAQSLRDAAHMNIMKGGVYNACVELFGGENVNITWGYLTKRARVACGLEKGHDIDARVISGNPLAKPCETRYSFRQLRRHNRQTHKANPRKGGKRQRNQSAYIVKGFRLYDIVRYKGKLCMIKGKRTSGSFALRVLSDGKVVDGVFNSKINI